MKIESRIVLSREELEIINKAYEILCDFTAESIRVKDRQTELKDKAQNAYNYIDDFLCEYADIYE